MNNGIQAHIFWFEPNYPILWLSKFGRKRLMFRRNARLFMQINYTLRVKIIFTMLIRGIVRLSQLTRKPYLQNIKFVGLFIERRF